MSARVLLVDDEEGLRITLAANLELEGFEVLEAGSGEQALALAAAGERLDIVLTDIRMPGINGVELFRRLKQMRPDLPVVLMTAFAMEELVEDALQNGAFTLVPKPFDLGHVSEVLQRATRRPVVLVVDDHAPAAETTAAALIAAGVPATAEVDPARALEAFRTGAADVCVVDLIMPGISGAELVERMKQIDPTAAMIAVSGHDVPDMVRRVAAGGAFRFMQKPFDVRQLIQSVASARGQARPKAVST